MQDFSESLRGHEIVYLDIRFRYENSFKEPRFTSRRHHENPVANSYGFYLTTLDHREYVRRIAESVPSLCHIFVGVLMLPISYWAIARNPFMLECLNDAVGKELASQVCPEFEEWIEQGG